MTIRKIKYSGLGVELLLIGKNWIFKNLLIYPIYNMNEPLAKLIKRENYIV